MLALTSYYTIHPFIICNQTEHILEAHRGTLENFPHTKDHFQRAKAVHRRTKSQNSEQAAGPKSELVWTEPETVCTSVSGHVSPDTVVSQLKCSVSGDNKQAGNGCRTCLYFVTSGSRLGPTGAAWLGKTPLIVGQSKRNTATAFAIMTHKVATSICKSYKYFTVSLFPLLEAAGVSVCCSHLLPLTSDTCHHQLTGCKQSITSYV